MNWYKIEQASNYKSNKNIPKQFKVTMRIQNRNLIKNIKHKPFKLIFFK